MSTVKRRDLSNVSERRLEASSPARRGLSGGLRIVLYVMLALAAVVLLLAFVVWPWMVRWGATDAEVSMVLPSDEFVPDISMQTTKALTVSAAPEQIYPWLLQLGVDRGGMYSYEWIENLFGLHVSNAVEIVPEYQQVQVGDFLRFVPPDFGAQPGPGLYVMEMVPDEAFILCFTMEGESVDVCPATWQFILTPQGDGTTRLILRNRITAGESWQNTTFGRLFMYPTFIMERKMLLTLRERAEEFAASQGDGIITRSGDVTGVWPDDGQSVDGEPILQWEAYPGAARYEVAVTGEDGMVVFSESTTDTVMEVAPALEAGSYRWAVQALDTGDNALAELHRQFRVKAMMEAISPAEGATVDAAPLLSWQAFPGAVSYQIVVVDDDAYPPVVVVDEVVTSTSYAITGPLETGSYSWTVWANDAKGTVIAELNRQFTVK